MTFIVATTSLPVNRPNETARTTITGTPHACAKKNDENSGHYINASSRPPERQLLEHGTLVPKKKGGGTNENSGHYVIASSRPPKRRLLERRTLVPKVTTYSMLSVLGQLNLTWGDKG